MTPLDMINDCLETALLVSLGLPVSQHQVMLSDDLKRAHAKWVDLYRKADARAKKAAP